MVSVKTQIKALTLFAALLAGMQTAVVVAQDAEQAVTLKKKVAIARFSNETRSGQSFLVDDNNDRSNWKAGVGYLNGQTRRNGEIFDV